MAARLPGARFRIMQYNVLAKRYARNMEPWFLYDGLRSEGDEDRARAILARHAARRPECHGTRRMTLLDSSVVRGLASKGRSSSRRLNRIWRPVIPELLAADIQDGTLPVPTKHMPADAATRNARTRTEPLRSPPAWLTALETGDYAPFDEIYGASTRQIPDVFFPEAPLPPARDHCDGRGHEQTSATKRGKETYSAPSPYAHPGSSRRSRSVPPAFWSPLLDANIGADTHARYLGAVSRFVVFVRQHGDGIASADDFDYWLSYYAHVGFVPGRPAKSEDSKVLYAFER